MGSVSFGAVCVQRPVREFGVSSATWGRAAAGRAAVGLPWSWSAAQTEGLDCDGRREVHARAWRRVRRASLWQG